MKFATSLAVGIWLFIFSNMTSFYFFPATTYKPCFQTQIDVKDVLNFKP
jgi:hypothetical protein